MPKEDWVNLSKVCVLCVDPSQQGLDILCQMLLGFGTGQTLRASTFEEAQTALSHKSVDLVITDCMLGEQTGLDLVKWLRRSSREGNRVAPVIVIGADVRLKQVRAAVNDGANYVVSKPVAAGTLLERIIWSARPGRKFVETDVYVGPDRRQKFEGVPAGTKGRRESDVNAAIGEAQSPNLSQEEIDAAFTPQRISL